MGLVLVQAIDRLQILFGCQENGGKTPFTPSVLEAEKKGQFEGGMIDHWSNSCRICELDNREYGHRQ
ncbi:hypothetical protein QYF36_007964 [Acer negundo]|nr:hypothetical protein QYF36_007964 [Acer negundo]